MLWFRYKRSESLVISIVWIALLSGLYINTRTNRSNNPGTSFQSGPGPSLVKITPAWQSPGSFVIPENKQTYRVTAYCKCEKCCGKWAKVFPRKTASGHLIKKGDKFVAAPKDIPFGTMLIVPGYNNGKPVPVWDRGGAIKSGKLDCYFDTHQEALNWGVKELEILCVVTEQNSKRNEQTRSERSRVDKNRTELKGNGNEKM